MYHVYIIDFHEASDMYTQLFHISAQANIIKRVFNQWSEYKDTKFSEKITIDALKVT